MAQLIIPSIPPFLLSRTNTDSKIANISKDTLKAPRATQVNLKDLQRFIKYLETPREMYIFQRHPKTLKAS